MTDYDFKDYCVCPKCHSELSQIQESLQCIGCKKIYEIRDGIPILLLEAQDDLCRQYLQNCERLAKDDLEKPLENRRDYRHQVFLDFMGDLRGKRVLDIGSSNGQFLSKVTANFRVAFDLSFRYLHALSAESGIVCICGDAEELPFKQNFFDVIIISDILEHLLNPHRFIKWLTAICSHNTRIFVHIPWEETLETYLNSPYQFSHLRSFNAFTFSELWVDFYTKRDKKTYPDLKYPFIFRLEGKIPLFIYNRLIYRYFFKLNVAEKDFQWRTEMSAALPRRERWLLWLFKPVFKMFEMRLRPGKYKR
jgi:SAM-dependent methyltransferase